MPEMDGFEVASHIKRRERTRHVPIIFLTAADRDAQLALRGYAVGAVDYLTKPFDPWVLRAKVSIFVDLWTKNRQLTRQAQAVREQEVERQRLTEIAEQAGALLRRGLAGDGDLTGAAKRALEVLERAGDG
jgi:PleD family two-component response regulator